MGGIEDVPVGAPSSTGASKSAPHASLQRRRCLAAHAQGGLAALCSACALSDWRLIVLVLIAALGDWHGAVTAEAVVPVAFEQAPMEALALVRSIKRLIVVLALGATVWSKQLWSAARAAWTLKGFRALRWSNGQ